MEQSLCGCRFGSVDGSLLVIFFYGVVWNGRINGIGNRTFLQIVRLGIIGVWIDAGLWLLDSCKCAVKSEFVRLLCLEWDVCGAPPLLKIHGLGPEAQPNGRYKMGRFLISALLGGARGGFCHG